MGVESDSGVQQVPERTVSKLLKTFNLLVVVDYLNETITVAMNKM